MVLGGFRSFHVLVTTNAHKKQLLFLPVITYLPGMLLRVRS